MHNAISRIPEPKFLAMDSEYHDDRMPLDVTFCLSPNSHPVDEVVWHHCRPLPASSFSILDSDGPTFIFLALMMTETSISKYTPLFRFGKFQVSQN